MRELAARVAEVHELQQTRDRLGELPHAWVLVFDADTDDEAVYSIELPSQPKQVVVAFEEHSEAQRFAAALPVAGEEAGEPHPTVQALDLEALVVSSREASFRVAVVLRGDLQPNAAATDAPPLPPPAAPPASPVPFITVGRLDGKSAPPPESGRVPFSVSFTMVPEDMYADRSAADYLDPLEDTVWVLVHDAGTSDAQYFSIPLNGTKSVICFRDETAAEQCCRALAEKRAAVPVAREELLENVLDRVDLEDEEIDVCLVDEVVDVFDEDKPAAPPQSPLDYDHVGDVVIATSPADVPELGVASADPRPMLESLYESSAEEPGGGPTERGGGGEAQEGSSE